MLFTRTTDLVQRLQVARRELALEGAIAKLDKYDLLILDDLAYVTKDQAETSVLFELIGARYERRSMLITANQPFGEWGKVFPDPAMTLAAIDRLVHHATIFEMNVESYRRRAALDRKRGPGGRRRTRQSRKLIERSAADQTAAPSIKVLAKIATQATIITSLPAAALISDCAAVLIQIVARQRAPPRMQLLAMAMARWVLPVPVPPTSTALRCWAMKPPPARSLTSVSLIGVLSNWKSSRSLASGSLAMVSWYLIERALLADQGVEQITDDALRFGGV